MQNELWDTSIYISKARLDENFFSIHEEPSHLSIVVVAELATGYAGRQEKLHFLKNYINHFARKSSLITPAAHDWYLTGLIIGEIISTRPDLKSKKSLLFNDCLIATSSRQKNTRVVTANRKDFELIRKWLNFEVEYTN